MEGFLSIIVSNAIWLLYSLSEGLREGSFDFYKESSKKIANFNDIKMFSIQRLFVLISTSFIMIFSIGWISIIFILGQIVTFKYFYYITYECSLRKIHNKDSENIKKALNKKKYD
jgi:hypothetical protein